MRKIKVKALYNVIPEKLTVNVSHLGLGKTVKVGELSFEGLEPVSYTHLDVYKRQTQYRSVFLFQNGG